ncbi:MAG: hypothetical protein RSD42_03215, partial [Oscillospiraceae bacterium]
MLMQNTLTAAKLQNNIL